MSVARAISSSGGVALSREQLASVMDMSSASGTFLMKIAAARLFNLVGANQGKYELTQLGFAILDEAREREARAKAFLNVPLYRRAYDEFRGKQLPPRPLGLEQAFVSFGVLANQKANALLAFEKSATQAGFFNANADRLVEPIIAGAPAMERPPSPVKNDEETIEIGNSRRLADDRLDTDRRPFIQGLLDTLPVPQTTWTVEGRAKWLQAAAHIFELIYTGSGEIKVIATPPPDAAKGKT